MDAANERRPNAILGVAAIIAQEAQKKRRHMPVSHLLARTAPVAQAVKPCFMMSPLSVSPVPAAGHALRRRDLRRGVPGAPVRRRQLRSTAATR